MNIVFDIGGTNMRIAVAHGTELGEIKKVPTPQDPAQGIAVFTAAVQELTKGEVVQAAAGCISADQIDSVGCMHHAKKLPAWEGFNIVTELSRSLGVRPHIANDCVVVGYGELYEGAGKEYSDIAYITVSTGVGGAHVMRNHDAAPVLGDLTLKVGDLEEMISGTAVRAKFGIEPKDLESIDERNKLADILAEGLIEIIAAWKPEAVVIGGSMIVGVNPIPLERVREVLTARGVMIPVEMAQLVDNGGLIGGAVLAKSEV